MNFIDAHVHVWTNDFAAYPLAAGWTVADMAVPHYGPENILAEARPSGVDRVVLIQMIYYGCDNRYMLDVIARQPATFRGIAVIDHTAADPAGEMRRLKALGVRGFRIYGLEGDLDHWLDHPGYATMFRCGAEERLAICPLLEPVALPAVDRMCERFPDTPVVIDHFARIGVTMPIQPLQLDTLCSLARHRRTHVKASAFYALGARQPPHDDLAPLIRRVVDAYGPRRLMWASDCPFQTLRGRYEDGIAIVRDRLDFLSPDDRQQMLRGTAERVLFW